MPDFSLEHAAGGIVAGIDEAGRGPWAGPVVAAAVVLDPNTLQADLYNQLDDSKRLSPAHRIALLDRLRACARIGVGRAEVDEIDAVNILNATLRAMKRAVDGLELLPDLALVDGNQAPDLPFQVQCVVKGDRRSLSIAAASIVAKVTRDRIMERLAVEFPGYGWEQNAGYGTARHRLALERLGVTPHHRRSFRPILNILTQNRV
jgi:ribonuclease HII